ncbi:MAG TPA: hypothetical protein VFX54_04050 [Candidatus Binatia bacterium]|nr:hypothetical protein [Candidatus Binatia bacterium]
MTIAASVEVIATGESVVLLNDMVRLSGLPNKGNPHIHLDNYFEEEQVCRKSKTFPRWVRRLQFGGG